MLFDPGILRREPWRVLEVVAIIVAGKFLAALVLVLAFGRPASTALRVSVSLAQIGELSFIVMELGIRLKLLPEEGRSLILAGAIFSITLNPLLVFLSERLQTGRPPVRAEE
jgi:CPA2 family monovalent cation:H+ antiporter-2